MEIRITFEKRHMFVFLFVVGLAVMLGFVVAQVSHPAGEIILPGGGTLSEAVPSGVTICTESSVGVKNCGDDSCSTAACTVDLSGDTVAGGTVNTCARFDANGYLVSAGGDCAAGDTDTDTDTNAGTACSGTYSYLNGEGNCRDVRADGDIYDSYAADTHAGTHCSGTYSYLNGAGHCRDVRADGDIYDTNTDYCSSGSCDGWLILPDGSMQSPQYIQIGPQYIRGIFGVDIIGEGQRTFVGSRWQEGSGIGYDGWAWGVDPAGDRWLLLEKDDNYGNGNGWRVRWGQTSAY